MLEQIIKKINSKNKGFVIWGVSAYSISLALYLKGLNSFKGFVDNNPSLWGKEVIKRKICYCPTKVLNLAQMVVIGGVYSEKGQLAVIEQLVSMQIPYVKLEKEELNFCIQTVDDKEFLEACFFYKMGYELNLEHPKTYSEKIQWMKLYNRNPLYTKLADKYEVKKYVSNLIGNEYIIPTLGVWNDVEEIDFEMLPEQFVLKCTHDSGSIIVCDKKENFNQDSAKEKLMYAMERNFYWLGREWVYKDIKPRIIAEPYMTDNITGELRDYKFFVFNGCVKAMFIASDRGKVGEDVKFDFYDAEFNFLPMKHGHANSQRKIVKPKTFEKMKDMAEYLSREIIPHVRVDFYEVNGLLYFGEFTFYHHCGWMPFEPEEWDSVFGEWLEL